MGVSERASEGGSGVRGLKGRLCANFQTKGGGHTYVADPFKNSSNIRTGTSPRVPVEGLLASYHWPSLGSARTWKKSPFSKESWWGERDLWDWSARITLRGGCMARAGLDKGGRGLEMWVSL